MGEYTLLAIQVYGLAIVISLLVAVMIRGVVNTLSVLGKKTTVIMPTTSVTTAVGEGDDHIAAITAAVWATVGPYRIVHIEPSDRGRAWATGSLFAHHTSHAVGPHPKRWESKQE
uniref:Oxaloacetate decarboxylase, gamma chain n=1 Tax=Candidatus Kentrum sp. MB TaxID=2138164 RepID=A0A450XXK9_9GAMM|nr:MAG: hypothetical protein BECKMB1821G_GA0114241_10667 [Candidatus Kentron sp. MB]VFK33996.1 MAG: hypothetical protein BECKMB1821I_GA0114274_105811 [Candidatus Kentron sp. MB]VFK76407.1 MAG: hypothetical protein BECKMB1821H_GA0114242_105511 [Candidatus Kentron sp. MB]